MKWVEVSNVCLKDDGETVVQMSPGSKVKVGVLQPGLYWDRFSALSLMGLEPHREDILRDLIPQSWSNQIQTCQLKYFLDLCTEDHELWKLWNVQVLSVRFTMPGTVGTRCSITVGLYI